MEETSVIRILFLLAICLFTGSLKADDPTKEQIEFFEKKIRPTLNDHCFECHSSKKQESDLRLDSRAAIITGGASGPAANLDDPDASLILEVLNYAGDVEMPPDLKLDDEIIDDFKSWIEMGLPWPKQKKTDTANADPLSMKERVDLHRKSHWAYQPLQKATTANTPNELWARNEIDQLIFRKLSKNNLKPSPEADRYTQTRRLYLALLGIPPTFAEVQEVKLDSNPDWYEKLVSRIMASPRYGERWGRHWLDVARYADTKGYSFQTDRNYPHAYTYRDYVINAFNDDKPYDDFVKEQLAADYIDLGNNNSSLAALGFLTVGRKFNNIHDDVDDKIDVVFRGLQGLTVACARCHDHKYDAIPTADYYSLYGVFVSGREGPLPYIGAKEKVEAFKKRRATFDAVQKKLNDFLQNQKRSIVDTARLNTATYFARILGFTDPKSLDAIGVTNPEQKKHLRKIERAWREYVRRNSKDDHPVWSPWKKLAAIKSEAKFESTAKDMINQWTNSKKKINKLVMDELTKNPPKSKIEIARVYGKVVTDVYLAWKKAGSNDRGLSTLTEAQRQIGIVLFTDRTPTEIKTNNIVAYLSDQTKKEHEILKANVARQKSTLPPELDRAMVVSDIAKPVQPFVFVRGQIGRRGKNVPRQFVEILSPSERKPFTKGAGRFEIAQQITNESNPLTSRVIANRIWMHLMGESIVATPSDFGTRCAEPVQRDVLDLLAMKLIERDWSIKSLQQLIVSSATFRQSSKHRTDGEELDTMNSLYWKANRQRLEFEALRDSMLYVSGELDLQVGGKSVEITKRPFAKRRAVYGYIDRQDLPNLLRAFDFASPDQSSAKRTETTVPQQLLFMMNSPFVLQRAFQIKERLPAELSPAEQVRSLYQGIFGRDPSDSEKQIATSYLEREQANKNRIEYLAQLLLLTNEFSFAD